MDQKKAIDLIAKFGQRTSVNNQGYDVGKFNKLANDFVNSYPQLFDQFKNFILTILSVDSSALHQHARNISKSEIERMIAASMILGQYNLVHQAVTDKDPDQLIGGLLSLGVEPENIRPLSMWIHDMKIIQWNDLAAVVERKMMEEERKQIEAKEPVTLESLKQIIQEADKKIKLLNDEKQQAMRSRQQSRLREIMKEIFKINADVAPLRSKLAVIEDEVKQRAQENAPHCTNPTDPFYLTDIALGEEGVISIIPDKNRPLLRDCYNRAALLKYFDTVGGPEQPAQIYEWWCKGSNILPGDKDFCRRMGIELPVNANMYKQRVYKLPLGNYYISQKSILYLKNPHYHEYVMDKFHEGIIGAENHTMGAVFGIKAKIYQVVPVSEYKEEEEVKEAEVVPDRPQDCFRQLEELQDAANNFIQLPSDAAFNRFSGSLDLYFDYDLNRFDSKEYIDHIAAQFTCSSDVSIDIRNRLFDNVLRQVSKLVDKMGGIFGRLRSKELDYHALYVWTKALVYLSLAEKQLQEQPLRPEILPMIVKAISILSRKLNRGTQLLNIALAIVSV